MSSKNVAASHTEMSQIVLPNHTNTLGNMMGGQLLYLMDMCAGVVAQRHSNRTVVTASVDHVEFSSPIKLGDIVTLAGHVNRSFRSSMEVEINVWAENPRTGRKTASNRAFYTMVAIDEELRPTIVPTLVPNSPEEQSRWEAAERRRQLRLVLAGRLKVSDAHELTHFLLENVNKADV
ncbi:MAG TPA: acyl-CoA thioesterase [Bacteroidetes bacterium]|nr:acyl-CoA thioesterase [Bacteroidota bacterium]